VTLVNLLNEIGVWIAGKEKYIILENKLLGVWGDQKYIVSEVSEIHFQYSQYICYKIKSNNNSSLFKYYTVIVKSYTYTLIFKLAILYIS